jgi:hypothetical protein
VVTASAGSTRATRNRPQSGRARRHLRRQLNIEVEYRIAPLLGLRVPECLCPFPYNMQPNLGDLSDASEFRALQFSFDVTSSAAIDLGTTSRAGTPPPTQRPDPTGLADKALLL